MVEESSGSLAHDKGYYHSYCGKSRRSTSRWKPTTRPFAASASASASASAASAIASRARAPDIRRQLREPRLVYRLGEVAPSLADEVY